MDTLCLEKFALFSGLAGGGFITSAVSFMNTTSSTPLNKAVGFILFSIGWMLLIKSFTENETRDESNKNILIFSSVAVWISAMSLRMLMDNGSSKYPMMAFGMIFMSAWMAIGYTIGNKSTIELQEKDEKDETAEIIGTIDEIETEEVEIDTTTMTTRLVGISAPILVFVAMMIVNGFERPRKLSAGVGLPLFASAWVTLAMINSFDSR